MRGESVMNLLDRNKIMGLGENPFAPISTMPCVIWIPLHNKLGANYGFLTLFQTMAVVHSTITTTLKQILPSDKGIFTLSIHARNSL